jgi:hypothetical protein
MWNVERGTWNVEGSPPASRALQGRSHLLRPLGGLFFDRTSMKRRDNLLSPRSTRGVILPRSTFILGRARSGRAITPP